MRIAIFLFLGMVLGCQPETRNEHVQSQSAPVLTYAQQEERLLDQVFMEVVGNSVYGYYMEWQEPPILPTTKSTTPTEIKKQILARQKYIEEWYENLATHGRPDTLSIALPIADTLFAYSENLLSEAHISKALQGLDSSFHALVLKLQSPKLKSEPWNIQTLVHKGKYIISKLSTMDSGYPSFHIAFSRIAFDATFTKACFYRDFICNRKGGDGTIFLLELQNGRWQLIKAIPVVEY